MTGTGTLLAHGVGSREDLPIPFSLALIGAAVVLVVSFLALPLFVVPTGLVVQDRVVRVQGVLHLGHRVEDGGQVDPGLRRAAEDGNVRHANR